MKLTPNYKSRKDGGLLFAVQLRNTDESIETFREILGAVSPNRETLSGITYDGEAYLLGSWLTVCLCEECSLGDEIGNIEMWHNEEFHETFEPIDVDPKTATRVRIIRIKSRQTGFSKMVNDIISEKMKEGFNKQLERDLISAFASSRANQEPIFGAGMKDDDTPEVPVEIAATKEFRSDLDGILQRLKKAMSHEFCPSKGIFPVKGARSSRERALAVTKIQEAIMWLGMDLKAISEETGVPSNPYPSSYDKTSPVIEPTADGLKL